MKNILFKMFSESDFFKFLTMDVSGTRNAGEVSLGKTYQLKRDSVNFLEIRHIRPFIKRSLPFNKIAGIIN